MEEMQRAFNKTIIKLENTSRMAEEQVRHPSSQWESVVLGVILVVLTVILVFIEQYIVK